MEDPGKHLQYAAGYLALGLERQARSELELASAGARNSFPGLTLQVDLARRASDWKGMAAAALKQQRLHPSFPDGWLHRAYALRRLESVERAQKVLEEARPRFDAEPILHFNLACYCALLGQEAAALDCLRRAVSLDPSYRSLAEEDEDLVSLRPRLHELDGA